MRGHYPTLSTLVILIAAGTAAAAIIEVPGDYLTIGEALAVATYNDEVHVAPGVYSEFGLTVPALVTLKGTGDSPEDVSIWGGGQGRVLLSNSVCWIENLEIRSGAATQGGGLAVLDGITYLTDVKILECTANLGAGILVRTGSIEMVRCEIQNNTATTAGGGIYTLDAPNVTMRDCVIAWNTAGAYGGAWSAARSTVTIEGCDVVGNVAQTWINNPYWGDNSGLGAESAAFDGLGVSVTRTISSDNTPEDGYASIESVLLSDAANRIESDCSLRWQADYPGWPGYLADQLGDPAARNVESDPLFCYLDGVPGDLSGYLGVAANSPCLPANSGGCDLIGVFGQACGATPAPDVPAARFALEPAYPNPFNPQTTIDYAVDCAGPVTLVVYGLDGRRVASLVNEDRAAGSHTVTWAGLDDRGRGVASGVYLCRLRSASKVASIRLTLVK